MTLIPRLPRPVTRDSTSLRDDRLFIVACDDTFAPQQYFDFFRFTRVKIRVVPTPDGTSAASHVLDRLLQFDHDADDELWMLLDTDHCVQGAHIAGFVEALREDKRKRVNVDLSKPSFELWLLLHHVEETALGVLPAAKGVEESRCRTHVLSHADRAVAGDLRRIYARSACLLPPRDMGAP